MEGKKRGFERNKGDPYIKIAKIGRNLGEIFLSTSGSHSVALNAEKLPGRHLEY